MSFQPVVPTGGIVGWQYLQRTMDDQIDLFTRSGAIRRDSDYFLENIASITSAAELVADRRLLGVALGAFGLGDDIDNRAFIRKVLEDGTAAEDALANKLADRRYGQLAEAFGFGPGEVAATGATDRMNGIVDRNSVEAFERAIGTSDESMRIALFARRELTDLAGQEISGDAMWYTVLGVPPVREMFETALGFPKSAGGLDIDRQIEIFRGRLAAATGSDDIAQFADTEALDDLTTRYFARAQIAASSGAGTPAANALTLLRAAGG